MALCDACHREWLAWLDYRIPRLGIQIVSHATRDTTPAGIQERRRRRYEDWRRTIQEAQDRIRAWCARDTEHRPAFVRTPSGADQFVLDVLSEEVP